MTSQRLPATGRGSAPGKIILFGEHAVVYGRLAIAIPVHDLQATATIRSDGRADRWQLNATVLEAPADLADLPTDDPLGTIVRNTLVELGCERPAGEIAVESDIPVASGLGSGAAVSTAIVRALAAHFGARLPDRIVSELVFEVEKIHHGTPSGIDNTVVAFGRPVCFRRRDAIEALPVAQPFTIAIADSGVAASTRLAVEGVAQRRAVDPVRFEALFDSMEDIARRAAVAIRSGAPDELGALMDENHRCLQAIGVSTAGLDALASAARDAGALGAKLSGGGLGGNVIALVSAARSADVQSALLRAGAKRVYITQVPADA